MEQQNSKIKRDIGLCLVLVLIFFGLLFVIVPKGDVYGSQTDWLSQHVSLAETIRNEMLDKETLFLDFIWLGGGNNAYNFSYYGYCRMDVLIGCLLPQVPMENIITVTMIASFLLTVLLCYYWLRKSKLNPGPSFLGAFFCMTASCFFHFHRQIMFINYMPLLVLALILTEWTIRKRKVLVYCIVLTGICFQSYYYAIACFIVIGIYWLETTKKWKDWLLLIKIMALSVGTSCILLLPTFLALLENKRESGGKDIASLFIPKLQLQGLLYSPYGVGFSMIILYLLVYGLMLKKYRAGSVGYLLLFCFPVIPYLLNGTLYTRAKILMPFLPLILMHCMKIMQEIWEGKIRPSVRVVIGMLVFLGLYVAFGRDSMDIGVLLFAIGDMAFILLFSCLQKRKNKAVVYVLLLIAPILSMLLTSSEESFVSEDKGEEIFTEEELNSVITKEWYRTDYMEEPLANVNQIQYSKQKTTGMYSSVTNKRYSAFYHDIMKTPIRINNRVALLPEVNPFLQYLMGVRYVVTDRDKLPYGYKVVLEKDGSVIAENEAVLPMAYLNTKAISREKFDLLSFPYTLETLLEYTVVEDIPEKERENIVNAATVKKDLLNHNWFKTTTNSQVEKKDFRFQLTEYPNSVSWEAEEDGIEFEVTKKSECSIALEESLEGKIGVLSFDVINESSLPVVITINKMRNKLSGKGAPYPNQNQRFTFYLDENMDDSLNIVCEQGKFKITNLTYFILPRPGTTDTEIKPVTFYKVTGNEVLNCEAQSDQDCYFVTSVPYQKGMEVYVDGKKEEAQIVNTAFIGVELTAGRHDVEVTFTPPGKQVGLYVTILSIIMILFIDIRGYCEKFFNAYIHK